MNPVAQPGTISDTFPQGAQLRHPNTRRQMRTKPIPTRQFRTHTTPHAPANEHGNAEAGPSTRVPQPTPYVDPPTPQPSEGTPEATVDAEYQTSTEEHGVPVGHYCCLRILCATERVSDVRHRGRLGPPTTMDDLANITNGGRGMLLNCAPWLNATRVPIKRRA